MDPEERLHRLDDHGFQGSVAFNFSFLFLQLIFWSVMACGIIMAIQRCNVMRPVGHIMQGAELVGGDRGITSRIERWKIEGHIARRDQVAQYLDRVARNTGRAVFWDDCALRAVESETCDTPADPF